MIESHNLFTPIHIGSMELKNRGVMPSMVSNYCNEDGSVSDRFIAYHAARANGGVGMIIVEAAYIDRKGKGFTNQIAIDRDELVPGLKKLTEAVHDKGAKIAIQIYHGGRQANTIVTGEQVVAPSAIPCPVMQAMPKELSIEEIKELVEKFADAAQRAKAAGFDAVEIHGAHGYLLNQFLSPNCNHRNDEYGGCAEKRSRFPIEVVDAVRNRVGDNFPLIYRITSEEFLPDGLMIEDTMAFSKVLVKHGINAINVSGSTYVAGKTSSGADDPLGFYVENAAKIKKSIAGTVPIIVANRIKTPELAESVIASGKVDMVATGRALLCDADFYNKIRDGRSDEIRICLSCNHCVSELMNGAPVSCIYNPLTGNELTYNLSTPAAQKKKVVVVGGGPSGMEAAYIAAMRGHSVTLFEQNDCLGGNVIPGTKPPYKSEMFACIDFLSGMLKRYHVDVKLNTKANLDLIKAENPDEVILSSGSFPITPKFPGVENDFVVTAKDVLLGSAVVGQKVVVIGGGSVGVETAELLNDRHKNVTVLEMIDEILVDMSPMLKAPLLGRVQSSSIRIMTGQKVLQIRAHSVVTDKTTLEDVDTVVLAVGYRPNNELETQLKTSGIAYRITGDAVKPRKIYQAVKEGFEAAYTL
jgi:2,4-dienoyl-CoA reductase-like NADH-dependent reductase (Old Yellow Enzyme family)/thioredoxin reductase